MGRNGEEEPQFQKKRFGSHFRSGRNLLICEEFLLVVLMDVVDGQEDSAALIHCLEAIFETGKLLEPCLQAPIAAKGNVFYLK